MFKPKGISSFDVIRDLRRDYPKGTKIGHGGTLDPLAEGVLVIGVGREATRSLHTVLNGTTKEYVADIELGKVSETDDAEGPIRAYEPADGTDVRMPTENEVRAVLESFKGEIDQVPPRYSAVKIEGKPAYKRARAGETFTLAPKQVTIHDIELLSYAEPKLSIRVETGSGVYIRSLARDIGEKLGTGAYMSALQRTRVGEFSL